MNPLQRQRSADVIINVLTQVFVFVFFEFRTDRDDQIIQTSVASYCYRAIYLCRGFEGATVTDNADQNVYVCVLDIRVAEIFKELFVGVPRKIVSAGL